MKVKNVKHCNTASMWLRVYTSSLLTVVWPSETSSYAVQQSNGTQFAATGSE
jgi:hypothetical protein